jgi:hypothetical protein
MQYDNTTCTNPVSWDNIIGCSLYHKTQVILHTVTYPLCLDYALRNLVCVDRISVSDMRNDTPSL